MTEEEKQELLDLQNKVNEFFSNYEDHFHTGENTRQLISENIEVVSAPTNYTATLQTLLSHLEGINTAIGTHNANHIQGGDGEIDGDLLDIDYAETNYTPATTGLATDVNHLSAHLEGIDDKLGTLGGSPLFGDASDVATTISSNTTLTRNMYYSSLTVNNGITLNTGGYWIYCTGTITNNGTISRNGDGGGAATNGANGGSGSGGEAGGSGIGGGVLADGDMSGALAGEPGGNAGSGTAGGGGNGISGDPGINQTFTLVDGPGGGNLGGSGGDGNGTTGGTGATGGGAGSNTAAGDIPRDIFRAGIMKDFTTASTQYETSASAGGSGGGGGGAGGNDGPNSRGGGGGGGGGSGGGGGIVVIFAKTITNTSGTISAKGGNGGAGGSGGDGFAGGAATGGGGGGGGGTGGNGGVLILVYQTLNSGTESVAAGSVGSGGTGGTGGAGGANGANGGTSAGGATGLLVKITT